MVAVRVTDYERRTWDFKDNNARKEEAVWVLKTGGGNGCEGDCKNTEKV